MSIDLLGTNHQDHITELTVFSQQVDHFQGLPWVFVRNIGHACRLGDPFRELVGVPQSTAAGDVHSSGVLACAGGPKGQSSSLDMFRLVVLGVVPLATRHVSVS